MSTPAAPDYRRIGFARLPEVPAEALMDLMNDPHVRRHLPLARGPFGREEVERFVAAKEDLWRTHGYGPWAFFLDGEFMGWGGLQPEGDDIDVGLVLHRAHWGAGPVLYRRFVTQAFEELKAGSVIALLPESRIRVAALRRLGFHDDGVITIGGTVFHRYRLPREVAGHE